MCSSQIHFPTFPDNVWPDFGLRWNRPRSWRKMTMPSDFPTQLEALVNGSNLSDTCVVRRILVIDDDREMADLLAQSLAREGFDLSTAQSGEDGIELGLEKGLELILLYVNLPDIS